jgi:organic radical activating enzyme
VKPKDILPAWSRILHGYKPFLALEITKSCPLNCPGWHAFHPNHVKGSLGLRELAEFRGQELVDRVLELVRRLRPIHVSLVGGEPLVRRWEIGRLLPEFYRRGIEVQLVTSAALPIPREYRFWKNLHVVVSVDGLHPEHDERHWPETYARILDNIAGQNVIVHCTITKQMASAPSRLREFAEFWSSRDEVRKIWFSLYTPQESGDSGERLLRNDRNAVLEELRSVRHAFPKVCLSGPVLDGFLHPPRYPGECIFARVTTCVSADLASEIVPCQLGGNPVCGECGCIASAGLAAIGRFRIAGLIPVSKIFGASAAIGQYVARRRRSTTTRPKAHGPEGGKRKPINTNTT